VRQSVPQESSITRAILMPYGPIVEPAGFTGSAGKRPQAMGDLGTKVEK
jgi:hypothetical protein